MKRALIASLAVLALLAVVVPSAPAQQTDKIVKKDGTVLPREGGRPIEVVKEGLTSVEYKMTGLTNTLKIPSKDVAEVKYGRMPDAYRNGLQSMKEDFLEQAVDDFGVAIEKGAGFHWLMQNALYRIAVCYVNIGNYPKAADTYRELLREVPDTRYFPEAWLGIIPCRFLSGGAKNEKAITKAIKDFQKAIQKNRLGNRWDLDIEYWELRLRDAKGEDISTAARELAEKATGENPTIANKARILIGDNLLGKNPQQAREFFDRVRRSAGARDYGVKAGAYRGLGMCMFKTGSEKDRKTFETAREFFLRSIVLADQHPDLVEREDLVRSLYYAGRCFVILRRGGDKFNSRFARDLFREVKEKFAGTEYARHAEDEIKKL